MSSIKNNNMFNRLIIKPAPDENIKVEKNDNVVQSLENKVLTDLLLANITKEKPKISVTAMINRDEKGRI